MWFLLAAGVRSKETKINLLDCICLCSEVEMRSIQPKLPLIVGEGQMEQKFRVINFRKLSLYLAKVVLSS